MSTPRTNKAAQSADFPLETLRESKRLETELTEMRTALSQVATNLGNGLVVSPDASVEFMTRDLPIEVKLHVSSMTREINGRERERDLLIAQLAEMTKERDEWMAESQIEQSAKAAAEGFAEELKAEREKVATLRKVMEESPYDELFEKALEATK